MLFTPRFAHVYYWNNLTDVMELFFTICNIIQLVNIYVLDYHLSCDLIDRK